ncbi:AraC family transcriptional regulator [Paenibacillus lautus]|uniref:AraC family transcriptional regulator n=1 Tax=Paenibacillus lautus TaxID=1401 RepID=UPI001C10A448|nr:AraC family transcriptional regulator [Paenibacillus lautus]MBU5348324.1 AraC family transcriptional regulator [Paenibacillus lautus]
MKANLSMGYNFNSLHTSYDFAYHSTTTEKDWHIFHMHEGMEFIYVHEGRGYAIIDQKIYDIGPRSLVYFQPYQLHGTKVYLDQGGVYARSILSLEPSELYPYLQPYPALKSFFYTLWKSKLTSQIITQLPENNPLENMFSHYHPILNQGANHDLKEEFTLFFITFLQYVKSVWHGQRHENDPITLSKSTYIEKIMAWIEDNYTKEFHLEDLSKELHLSQHYIAHLFHNSTGTNITQYLIARRMRQACWLLRNSTLSIQQICLRVGLSNVSYFCKKFKEYTGRTPLKYRTQKGQTI